MEKVNDFDEREENKVQKMKQRINEKLTNETSSADLTFLMLVKIEKQLKKTNDLLEIIAVKPTVKEPIAKVVKEPIVKEPIVKMAEDSYRKPIAKQTWLGKLFGNN